MYKDKNEKSACLMNWRNRIKQQLVEYKGGKCEKCGYNKPIYSAYQFHHRDPKEKDFAISRSKSYEKSIKEVDKCDLLCSNCHAEIHWNLTEQKRKENQNLIKYLSKGKRIKGNLICRKCKKEFYAEWFENRIRKYCSQTCSRMMDSKIPSKEKLEELLKNGNYSSIGRIFGVRHNTVKKWTKKYNLSRKGLPYFKQNGSVAETG